MSTRMNETERLDDTSERREQPRFSPPLSTCVTVGTSGGTILRARIHDTSVLGGACLAFTDDPQIQEGDFVTVSHGQLRNHAEVRHVGYKYGKYPVGVRWSTNATLLGVACDPTKFLTRLAKSLVILRSAGVLRRPVPTSPRDLLVSTLGRPASSEPAMPTRTWTLINLAA
jgi:hypothetical protein